MKSSKPKINPPIGGMLFFFFGMFCRTYHGTRHAGKAADFSTTWKFRLGASRPGVGTGRAIVVSSDHRGRMDYPRPAAREPTSPVASGVVLKDSHVEIRRSKA